ncbi:hypothetical protein HMI54_005247 [Coelomomyces lativittatus]|nr:hypothetical protein HMI56_004911 [Coelomomyces lativittatus]KAJ1514518.1 hypothetical protein HMI55_004592 [Coelomomyces lativittatus]KAJ1517542.1 hypothetical protein HMI54_005247 [Coelomomyces lativittatus]
MKTRIFSWLRGCSHSQFFSTRTPTFHFSKELEKLEKKKGAAVLHTITNNDKIGNAFVEENEDPSKEKEKKVKEEEHDISSSSSSFLHPTIKEINGPKGRPEPTRYGDWEYKGRVIDF